MFSCGTPPATVVSLNARFQPTFHAKIAIALGQLRAEGILIVGTGDAVHNLYRNNWIPMLKDKDNFQVNRTLAPWAIEFEQSVSNVIKRNEGTSLVGSLARLNQSPRYKDAHPPEDHYLPVVVASGAASTSPGFGKLMATIWELQNMCNNQYLWGSWKNYGQPQAPPMIVA